MTFEYWRPKTLFEISSARGIPIALDEATQKRTFDHFARFLIDIDLTASLHEWLLVEYKDFACYIVHVKSTCKINIDNIIQQSLEKKRSGFIQRNLNHWLLVGHFNSILRVHKHMVEARLLQVLVMILRMIIIYSLIYPLEPLNLIGSMVRETMRTLKYGLINLFVMMIGFLFGLLLLVVLSRGVSLITTLFFW